MRCRADRSGRFGARSMVERQGRVGIHSPLLGEQSLVGRAFLGIEQSFEREIDFGLESLGLFPARRLHLPAQEREPNLSGRRDHVGVSLERRNPDQPIIMRRLVVGRNTKPLVIRIELAGSCFRHAGSPPNWPYSIDRLGICRNAISRTGRTRLGRLRHTTSIAPCGRANAIRR